MRQIPFAYMTLAYGPVYAYAVTEDRTHAKVVTWEDRYVEVAHDDLQRFPEEGELDFDLRCDKVVELEVDLTEANAVGAEHNGRRIKCTIGRALFGQNLWQGRLEGSS